MKRDLNIDLCTLDGKTKLVQRTEETDPVTGEARNVEGTLIAANIVILALLTPYTGEEIDAKEKVRRGTLAERIYRSMPNEEGGTEGTEVEMDMEEGTLILNLVARTYAPLIVMQINRIIEG